MWLHGVKRHWCGWVRLGVKVIISFTRIGNLTLLLDN
jgi:hypothetical protein